MNPPDWSTGVLADFPTSTDAPHWRMVCAADWMPRGGHVDAMLADPAGFYGDLLPTLTDADLRLVNVECVLGDAGEPIRKDGPNLRVHERTAAALSAVPFDVACLANNHTFDFGVGGLARTVEVLRAAGLSTVGAGLDGADAALPLTTAVRGVPVVVINCGEGEECRSVDGGPGVNGFDLVDLREQITRAKADGAVVIVVHHGGREHVPVPPPYVVRDLRAVADLGADVVIGHHPHVPQGFEVHHGVPIAYSLGNFAFHFDTPQFFHHVGYVVCVDFAGHAVRQVRAVPYVVESDGLRLLQGSARQRFDDGLSRGTAVLADDDAVRDAWDAVVDHYATPESVRAWLEKCATSLASGDRRAAAGMANRFFTPAHTELMSRALRRISVDQQGTASMGARDLLALYLDSARRD